MSLPVFQVVDVPGDGSCMYHAIGLSLHQSGQSLRALLARHMREHPDFLLNAVPLSDWISWQEGGLDVAQYAARVQSNQWGGALEQALIARLFGRPILVFVRDPSGGQASNHQAVRVSTALPHDECDGPVQAVAPSPIPILVLYTGNHYLGLIPASGGGSPAETRRTEPTTT